MKTNAKKIAQIFGLSVFFLFIITYTFFCSRDLIYGIKIKNVNIIDGVKVSDALIKIKGSAKNATKLILNGREISVDENGNFNETIALLSGYNVVNILAKDKFGYSDEENYQIIYEVI